MLVGIASGKNSMRARKIASGKIFAVLVGFLGVVSMQPQALPQENVYTITISASGRLIYPDSGVVAYTYDLDGKLETRTDQKGQVTTYSYNNRDLLTTKVYDDGGANEGTQTFTHDSLRRMTGNTDDNSGNKDVTASFMRH
ncbi:MAG: RHS repeat domain-containing protein [Planctomycetota bacterium]